jgi:hypothetical protein
VLYEVTRDELEQLERETGAVGEDFSFFLVGLTIAITVAATLFSVPIESNRVFECFVIALAIGTLMAAFFGIRWYRGRAQFKKLTHRIRSRIASLGEEGDESDLSDQIPVLQQKPGGPQ